jgi:hypothetical protein
MGFLLQSLAPSYIRSLPEERNVDRTCRDSAALQNTKDFYWLLILLLLAVGQVESVQAAPASLSGAEPRFPKPVAEYHDEQVPSITAKLVQRIQAEPFNLVGTLREMIEEPDEGDLIGKAQPVMRAPALAELHEILCG